MKFVSGALLLTGVILCSCSTTPVPTVSRENQQAVQSIHEQERFAYPLSFSEGLLMNGKDYADTIEAYSAALRKIDLSRAPVEFQAAFQNYIGAWEGMKALAETEPQETFWNFEGLPATLLESPINWELTSKPLDELRRFVSGFRHAKRDIGKSAKALRAWQAVKGRASSLPSVF